MNVSRLMEDSSDSEYDVEAVANEAIANILPKKSRPQFEKAYTISGFGVTKKISNTTENVLLAYLEEKSKILEPSTLWSLFLMLKATLNIKENIDVHSNREL
jgi:hypothetical protein